MWLLLLLACGGAEVEGPNAVVPGPVEELPVRVPGQVEPAPKGLEGTTHGPAFVHVVPGSAAAEAGLTKGDIIVGLEGSTDGWAGVVAAVTRSKPGDTLKLNRMRDDQVEAVAVTVGSGPEGRPELGLIATEVAN